MMVDRRLWFRHRCIVCKLLFVSERDLVLHEATHEKPKFACTSCSEVFETDEQYSFHASIGCEAGSKAQVCKVCGAVFEQVRDLYDHHSAAHLDEYKFRCKVCSATFSWLENLEKHELLHQTNSSMCKTCGAIFGSMASLKVHLWKAHSVNIRDQDGHMLEMPFACRSNYQDCKSIGTSAELCFGCRRSGPGGAIMRPGDEKPYKCHLCNWAFKHDFSYVLHMKMHREKNSPNMMTHASKVLVNRASRTDIQVHGLKKPKLRDDLQLHSNTSEAPRNTKKIVYIRRANSLHSFPSSKPYADKRLEMKTGISAQDRVVEGQKQTDLTANDNGCRNYLNRGPVVKSGRCQNFSPNSNSVGAFTCKKCMVTFQYDFSYVAHMKYHEKVKQLDSEGSIVQLATQSCRRNLPNSHPTGNQVFLDGSGSFVNSGGTVLIKMSSLLQQDLKMYDFPDGKLPLVCPAAGGEGSAVKYFLIKTADDLPVPDAAVKSESDCVVEEVINVDSQNPSVLGAAYMPDEINNCLSDEFSTESTDVAQVIVVENADNGEYLLNSDMQVTAVQMELDGIGENGSVDTERIGSNIPVVDNVVETIEEAYYGVLVEDRPEETVLENEEYSSPGDGCAKPHVCSFCRADFRWKTGLQAHMRKHHKLHSKVVSKVEAIKDGRNSFGHR